MSARRAHQLFSVTLAAATFASAAAHAQAFNTTWSQEALSGVGESLESPELRALRSYEEEMFGVGPQQEPTTFDPDCVYGAPEALSSELRPTTVERAGQTVDLSFLENLSLPSIPVRWDSRVIEYLLFFRNDPRGRAHMAAWLRRMERYGPMIRRVLAEHSLPRDLEIVAMVESGYDPTARSAASAQGLWQFVKVSGEYYGLRIDHWVDERLDPVASTHAAARFLRDLYDRFESWELAFAGYNMGYTGLLRTIRKYNTNDYWLLSHLEAGLPFETSLYVAKITAAAIIANNPEKFGFDDLAREGTIELTKVDVPAGTPLRPIAAAAGLSVEELAAVNPHFKKKRVPPGEPLVGIYLPEDRYERFAARWSKSKTPAQHTSYVVRFGERLEDVARRFGLSPAELRALNDLDDDASVGPGFPMIVPATGEIKTVDGQTVVATVPDREIHLPDRRRVFYQVTSNDTAEAVARFFEVTVDELNDWNNLGSNVTLQKGMLLQLFVRPELDLGRATVLTPDEVKIMTLGSQEFFDFHEGQRGRVRVRYRVQPGETMKKLAEKFELSQGSIGRINQFSSHKELSADEWIVVYVPEQKLPELERKGLVARIRSEAELAEDATDSVSASEDQGGDAQRRTPSPGPDDASAAAPPDDEKEEAAPPPPDEDGERAQDEARPGDEAHDDGDGDEHAAP
jgi:membrane-bound lytic murein transglycosylase D